MSFIELKIKRQRHYNADRDPKSKQLFITKFLQTGYEI